MITLTVDKLVGGSIVVGSSGHADTRFTLQGGTVETYDITGTLDQQWTSANGYFDETEYSWLKIITQADIGNTVTSIGESAFSFCTSLESITIPASVTSFGSGVFDECSALTSITVLGKTTAQAQDLLAWTNAPAGCTIHCTDGDIVIQ